MFAVKFLGVEIGVCERIFEGEGWQEFQPHPPFATVFRPCGFLAVELGGVQKGLVIRGYIDSEVDYEVSLTDLHVWQPTPGTAHA